MDLLCCVGALVHQHWDFRIAICFGISYSVFSCKFHVRFLVVDGLVCGSWCVAVPEAERVCTIEDSVNCEPCAVAFLLAVNRQSLHH